MELQAHAHTNPSLQWLQAWERLHVWQGLQVWDVLLSSTTTVEGGGGFRLGIFRHPQILVPCVQLQKISAPHLHLVNATGNSPVSRTADPRSSQRGQVIRGLR